VITLELLRLGRRPVAEHPLVQELAAAPHRLLRVDVRTGDIAVQRHADL
jgi:hypothetical protein